jgi:hypothetical protein
VVISIKNLKTTILYRGLVAASALTTLATVAAAGKKW